VTAGEARREGAAARVLLVALAGLGAMVFADRAGTYLHEVAGHLGVAAALGARPRSLQVTLFGGGWVHFDWPQPPAPWARAAATLGGIAVQTVAGLALAIALSWRAPGGAADLCARIFAAACTGGGIWYLVHGSYYGRGDPAAWRWLWKPGLAAALPLTLLAARPALAWLAANLAPGAGYGRRLLLLIAAAAIAGPAFAGLKIALVQEDDTAAKTFVEERRATEIADARAAKRARIEAERLAAARALAAKGEPVPEALERPLTPAEIEPRPDEIRRPFPIEGPLLACFVVAALLALAPAPRPSARPIAAWDAAAALAVGAAAIGAVWPLMHGVALEGLR
jgi:hypothetical protein